MNRVKRTIVSTAALCALALAGCGDPSSSSAPAASAAPIKSSAAVYFSRVGNTDFPDDIDAVTSASLNRVEGTLKGNAQLIAEWAAEAAGCKTFEVVAEKAYPADYDETVDLARTEQGDKARPALKSSDDLSGYDTLWLAFPNWWADLPMPLYTFFEKYDLSGKNIYVFVTHEGSGYSSTIDTIKELEPEANVIQAMSVRGGSVTGEEQNIKDYVKKQLG